jgi:RNA polymerase sigma factor (sigma-70 family)
MRLLSEYMSVPEINGTVVTNSSLVDEKHSELNKEVESPENRNLQLARQVEEQKTKLINDLSKFPVTALWLLNKYQQNQGKGEHGEEAVMLSEFDGFLKDIKKHYRRVSQFPGQAGCENAKANAERRLRFAIQQFPFGFDDLTKIIDVIVYAYKSRGGAFQPKMLDKKQFEIVSRRLQVGNRSTKEKLSRQFKEMGFHPDEVQFLYLTADEMSSLIISVVLAEHYWLNYRQQLATANSKLVLYIANQYRGNFLDFEDLVQEGHTGLLKAVDRFKYRLGFQFSTYAGYWIRQAISRALSRSERVVRIPCGQIATINKVFRAKDEILSKTGKEPSAEVLAEYTGLSQDDLNVILAISQSAIPLEAFDEDEDELSFAPINFIEQKVFAPSYNMIASSQLENLVNTAIKTLNPREAKILCCHFGVGADQQQTLQEIGAELNLTRERVRQIQVVALNKIKMRYGQQLLSFL